MAASSQARLTVALIAGGFVVWGALVYLVQGTTFGDDHLWLHPAGHGVVLVLWLAVAIRLRQGPPFEARDALAAAFAWVAFGHLIEGIGSALASGRFLDARHFVPVLVGNIGGIILLARAWRIHRRARPLERSARPGSA